MENTIKQRIKEIIKYKGFTINFVSKKIGVAQNTLNRQINGDTAISGEVILSIVGYFDDISSEWLLTGKGEMLKPHPANGLTSNISNIGSTGDIVVGSHIRDESAFYGNVKNDYRGTFNDVNTVTGSKKSSSSSGVGDMLLKKEVEHLKGIIAEKDKLIAEKDRVINLLFEKR